MNKIYVILHCLHMNLAGLWSLEPSGLKRNGIRFYRKRLIEMRQASAHYWVRFYEDMCLIRGSFIETNQ